MHVGAQLLCGNLDSIPVKNIEEVGAFEASVLDDKFKNGDYTSESSEIT